MQAIDDSRFRPCHGCGADDRRCLPVSDLTTGDETSKGEMTESFGASPESVAFCFQGKPDPADGTVLLIVRSRFIGGDPT